MKKETPLQQMKSFTIKNLPDLDTVTIAALELFTKEKLDSMSFPFKNPLVVGSGNAAATGKIIFNKAIFATESDYENKINSSDGVILISASGEKHAPIIAKKAKAKKKKVYLITNSKNSSAEKYADKTYILPKNREPYTYNTSTYMGMILANTKEDPKKILNFINTKIKNIKLPKFSNYNGYYLLIPKEFSKIDRLFQIKFIELFGRNIAHDTETFEQTKHATTVVPSNKELFISFGKENHQYGKHRLQIPLPKKR